MTTDERLERKGQGQPRLGLVEQGKVSVGLALLEAIEDLNRAGKSAFDGDAAHIALWNKDILARARKSRKETPPAPSPA